MEEPATPESNGPESEQPVENETSPGSQIQCRTIGEQLVVSIAPGSGLSAGFLGSFPVFFMGGLVLITLAAPWTGLSGDDFWLFIPLGLLWLFGAVLFYFWLRGRFGRTQILIEPGRLVIDFELFGRH